MNFYELMNKRRSVRGFTERELTDDEISMLLEAATAAPNACNYQSWHFYVVRGREKISGFVPTIYRGEWFRSSAIVFVVCTDAEKLGARFGERGTDLFAIQDTACAVDHLMLMAAGLGLGSCFVGAFDEVECRRYLGIPEGRRPVALVPVGEPATDTPKRPRKPIGEVVTFVGEDS
ncbi:MAG TPA: nitroreductase family protein [Clostridiales bacterium]|jgi:nitroreductase|nr:nitroreductase family protein [Clostridiales bacterium]